MSQPVDNFQQHLEGTIFESLASHLYIIADDYTEAALKLEIQRRAKYALIAAKIFSEVKSSTKERDEFNI
ncbi:MAG: hypothetical protein F6K54_32655 [Okeania sp. SIO3B5]|uniref:hypothetical protein n=1 Tax=Okeania sp. SIO3B5 TaxID=2607811 RepID=UPI0013FFE02C|nr:hypothetical protein [Okeania sp. SIO3B5]NEO57413.1 hypothetical protein [Okeania sp. SIO3B5]